MDELEPSRKKPRIRKGLPTMRERAEKARTDSIEHEPKTRGLSKSFRSLFIRTGLANNPVSRFVGRLSKLVVKILGFLMPRYFINSWYEVRQVTWPNRRETWRLTAAVFVFAIVFGASVAIVDKGLQELFRKVIIN